MNTWESLYGPNVGYALELYERYRADPEAVDSETRAMFDRLSSYGDGGAVETMERPTTATAIPSTPAASGDYADGARIIAAAGETNGATDTTANPAGPDLQYIGPYAEATSMPADMVGRVVLAARLARSIREYGHLAAQIDPLGAPGPGDPMIEPATHGITEDELDALPASIVWPTAGPDDGSCLDAIKRLRAIYSGHIGYEFDHVQDFTERAWLHQTVEAGVFLQPLAPERRRAILERLSEVEGLERFLHTKFLGQKRFSIEGTDMLVPMLDEVLAAAGRAGTREALIGMSHRGRLNVLAHTLGKPYPLIFSEFHDAHRLGPGPSEGSTVISHGWTGDVKYHLGARKTVGDGVAPIPSGASLEVTLADNPSHLEFVNPVIEGQARAAQDKRDEPGPPRQDVKRALPIAIHGDAAFPGEGVVAETLNLSRLAGYGTGGTVHIIVNNQIGFTTPSEAGRSTLYASDLAKGFEIPIVHINADDPEACLGIAALAHCYRERFHKDFLIDLVGYRRYGHNEGDEPSFTQPRLYAQIAAHKSVRVLYAEQLIAEGVVTPDEVTTMQQVVRERLDRAYEQPDQNADEPTAAATEATFPRTKGEPTSSARAVEGASAYETAVPLDLLRAINKALWTQPDDFTLHPKLESQMARRREALDGDATDPTGPENATVDWGLAETLALGSILAAGTPIRLTGQDTERGTFSQRHLVLHDPETGSVFTPLQSIPQARASFAVYNSPLSEAAALGFEYGYTVHAPDALVLWEAQFGDFANAGQVLIDQFIMTARAKWRQQPSLVLLLPHGYEGQGPEHSSARIERFLQLAAEGNAWVVNCTTAAQYFHLLRLQAARLKSQPQPLIAMTPKSLLRHRLAASSPRDLATGRFEPVLDDMSCNGAGERRDAIRRLVLCSGKVAVDLVTAAAENEGAKAVAIARVEQLYPFPTEALERVIGGYPDLTEVVWLQEEPRNMGAWSYMAPRLRGVIPDGMPLRYIGRPERSSTAEGMADAHAREQECIVEAAFRKGTRS